MKLGEYLVIRGVVSLDDVLAALEIQRRRQIPFGRVAVDLGLLTLGQVFDALNRQASLRDGDDSGHQTDLVGDFLLDLGYLNKDQVNQVLQAQAKTRPQIGEVLVEMGVLTSEVLHEQLTAYVEAKRQGTLERPAF